MTTPQGNTIGTTLLWMAGGFFVGMTGFGEGHPIFGLVSGVGMFVLMFCIFHYLQTGEIVPRFRKKNEE